MTVTLVLDRAQGNWVISDIVYPDGNTLLTSLTQAFNENDAQRKSGAN